MTVIVGDKRMGGVQYIWARLSGRLVVLAALLSYSLIAAATPARAEEEDGYVPGEVVVKLNAAASLPAVAAQYGLNPLPIDQFGSRPIYRLRILDGAAPPDKAATLEGDPLRRVIYAEANYLGQTPEGRQQASWADGGGAGAYAGQRAPRTIRLAEAHRVTRGAGITVAVLDSGVDATHPALAGRLAGGYDFVDMDTDPSEVGTHAQHPVYGHGTHVAGLVALAAPEARIMPVRVLDEHGAGNVWVLAEALAYAADPDGNPATDDGADVINLSLSTRRSTELLEEAIAGVTCEGEDDDSEDDEGDEGEDRDEDEDDCLTTGRRGAVVVLAAGNSGDSAPQYPAAEGVAGSLAVAASTRADTLAAFSTRGPWVRVAAPGEQIVSSVPGGGYGAWSGTSMAAPLAAGQVALLRSAYPGLRPEQVVARIVVTAAPLGGATMPRIDVVASLVGVAGP